MSPGQDVRAMWKVKKDEQKNHLSLILVIDIDKTILFLLYEVVRHMHARSIHAHGKNGTIFDRGYI